MVSDGALGIVKAIDACFPRSARQCCMAHRIRNLAAKVPESVWPESVRPEFKARVNAVYNAPGRAIARDLAKGIVRDFEREHPTAVSCFLDDFEACIAHQRMPINHHSAIRTTSLLERLFAEERCRLKVIPNAFSERAVLKLMFGAMWRAAVRWKPIRVLEFEARQLERIRVVLSEEYEKSTGLPAAKRRAAPHAKLSSKIGT